jgi:hypothetical protein
LAKINEELELTINCGVQHCGLPWDSLPTPWDSPGTPYPLPWDSQGLEWDWSGTRQGLDWESQGVGRESQGVPRNPWGSVIYSVFWVAYLRQNQNPPHPHLFVPHEYTSWHLDNWNIHTKNIFGKTGPFGEYRFLHPSRSNFGQRPRIQIPIEIITFERCSVSSPTNVWLDLLRNLNRTTLLFLSGQDKYSDSKLSPHFLCEVADILMSMLLSQSG